MYAIRSTTIDRPATSQEKVSGSRTKITSSDQICRSITNKLPYVTLRPSRVFSLGKLYVTHSVFSVLLFFLNNKLNKWTLIRKNNQSEKKRKKVTQINGGKEK